MSSRHACPDANCQVTLAWGAAKSLPYLHITICEKCDKLASHQSLEYTGFLELPNYYMYIFTENIVTPYKLINNISVIAYIEQYNTIYVVK